jgi:hypothetical protein
MNTEKIIEIATQWTENPPSQLRNATDLRICKNAILLLSYRGLSSGLTQKERVNLNILVGLRKEELRK